MWKFHTNYYRSRFDRPAPTSYGLLVAMRVLLERIDGEAE